MFSFKSLAQKYFPSRRHWDRRKKKFPLRVFSVEGVFVPYRVKVTMDEGSSVHLFPRREQEDPSIFSATKRLGRFSKASMRETNIITSPSEVQRHEKRSRGEFGSGRVFFFFPLQGSRRGHGHSMASRAADGGVLLFLMGKCHSIALAVLFSRSFSIGFGGCFRVSCTVVSITTD